MKPACDENDSINEAFDQKNRQKALEILQYFEFLK
jgi:hypothetical protein